MYTATPPSLGIFPATLHISATNPRAWWTIPEADRLHMHAFMRPSQKLRLKVRHAPLRSLHYTSPYKRLLVANKLKGPAYKTAGRAIHKKLYSTPMKGTTLLKFIYGQLYNGKTAKRTRPYGRLPTLPQV